MIRPLDYFRFCDLLEVPYADAMMVPLATGVSPVQAAAVGCNLVDVYRAVAPYLGEMDKPSLLVMGGFSRSMGLYAVAMARALGADVVFTDDDAQALAQAEALGACAAHLDSGVPKGHRLVFDASFMPERLSLALAAVGMDGVCVTTWGLPGPRALTSAADVPLPGHVQTRPASCARADGSRAGPGESRRYQFDERPS